METKYNYKTIIVQSIMDSSAINHKALEVLNGLYEEGWEYVGAVSQYIGAAGGNYLNKSYAPILYTLRKAKISL